MKTEFAVLFSMLMPGAGQVYLGKTVKGVILIVLAMIGLSVFILPRVRYDIAFSTTETVLVGAIWAIAWIVGIIDARRSSLKE